MNFFSGTHKARFMLSHWSEVLKRIYSLIQPQCLKIHFLGGGNSPAMLACVYRTLVSLQVS